MFEVRPQQTWKSQSKLQEQRSHVPTVLRLAVALLPSSPHLGILRSCYFRDRCLYSFELNCIESALRMMSLANYLKAEQLKTAFVITVTSHGAGREETSARLLSTSFYVVSVWGWAR